MRKRWELSPSHLVIVSFAVLIAVGTVFLALPFSAQGQPLNWVDALFLATSAVCVTGLTPVDPGSTLSSFGQVVLLLLIQIGGLGYMSLSALVALFLRRRLSVTERLTLEVMWGELVEVWRLLRYAVLFTLSGGFLSRTIPILSAINHWRCNGFRRSFYQRLLARQVFLLSPLMPSVPPPFGSFAFGCLSVLPLREQVGASKRPPSLSWQQRRSPVCVGGNKRCCSNAASLPTNF